MDEAGISTEEFKPAFERGNTFASGIAVDYGASVIVAKPRNLAEQGDVSAAGRDGKNRVVEKQNLAANLQIRMHMPCKVPSPQPLLADVRPSHLQATLQIQRTVAHPRLRPPSVFDPQTNGPESLNVVKL